MNDKPKRAKFITFEGCDGSGKTTQINLLKDKLKDLDLPNLFTREPGGTSISEKIRNVILDGENKDIAWQTEALLYAASRAQLVGGLIKPALKVGTHVICDRYTDSTLAYQGYGRGLDLEDLVKLNNFATGGLKPDLTILLDIKPEEALKRIIDRKADRLEEEEIGFQRKVREGYLALAHREPRRFILVDANQSIKEVHGEVFSTVLTAMAIWD